MLGDLKQKMQLAEKHLHQVQTAALDPVDWASLSMFGLYALEAAVDAASCIWDWTRGAHTTVEGESLIYLPPTTICRQWHNCFET